MGLGAGDGRSSRYLLAALRECASGYPLTNDGLLPLGEEPVTSHREGTDDEHPDQPDQDATKIGTTRRSVSRATTVVAQGLMIEDSQRDTPPGEHGVHGCSQHPGSKEIPNLVRLIGSLFWGEEARNAGEVDAAEGDGQDGGPANTDEASDRRAGRPAQNQ